MGAVLTFHALLPHTTAHSVAICGISSKQQILLMMREGMG